MDANFSTSLAGMDYVELIMQNVNVSSIVDMALDMKSSSSKSIDRVCAYMNCCMNYRPHTIIIGQSPYQEPITPTLASAFSQSK